MTSTHRHLAAIMFSDIVGYTAMMGSDEVIGMEKAKHYRKILQKNIDRQNGTLIQNYGDGSLTTFSSVVDAVQCAKDIQEELKGGSPYVPLRIGIHLGDIVIEGEEIYGNGVNVASRIESMGVEGAILLSKPVYEQLKNHQEFNFASLGKFEFKNVEEPLEVFALSNAGFPVPSKKVLKGKFKEKTKGKFLFISSLVILVLVFGGWLLWRQLKSNGKSFIRSIAVLPIDNFTGDEEQQYLFSGIQDKLITSLWKIGSLRVPSKKSTDLFMDSTKSIQDVASGLGVDALVKTSVTRFDDSIQLNVQLIQAFPQENFIWAEVFDRPVKNITSMFNDITQAITSEISLKLSRKEKELLSDTNQVDPRAYLAYQNGRFHWYNSNDLQELELAAKYFEEAIKIDPDYALAYVGLADATSTPAHVGYVAPGDNFAKAKDLLLKALTLEPDLAEAHDLLARIRYAIDWKWQEAEAEFKKAIGLKPGFADVRAIYAQYLMTRGRKKEAIAQVQKAKELDPLNLWTHFQYNLELYFAGRYKETIDSSKKYIEGSPGDVGGYLIYYQSLFMTGQLDECAKVMSKYYQMTGDSTISKMIVSGRGKNSFTESLKRVADEMSRRSEFMYIKPTIVATIYMMAGEKMDAMIWLKKALEEKDSWLVYMINHPFFGNVHQEPVFREILDKMNLSEKDLLVR